MSISASEAMRAAAGVWLTVIALWMLANGDNMRAARLPLRWLWRAWAAIAVLTVGGRAGGVFGIMWVACDVLSMVLMHLVEKDNER